MTQFSVREKSKTEIQESPFNGTRSRAKLFPRSFACSAPLVSLLASCKLRHKAKGARTYSIRLEGRMRRPEHETNDPTTINVSSIYTVVLIRARVFSILFSVKFLFCNIQ